MRIALISLCFLLAACAGPPYGEQGRALAAQHRSGLPLGHASRAVAVPDVAAAYRIQQAFVQARYGQAAIAGYKGGLTAEPAWRKFGLSAPVVGVLAAEGARQQRVARSGYARLMLETELAWRFSTRIDAPVADIATLKARVDGVAPAIELPDLGFADLPALNGLDLIAANVSARGFIVGTWQAPQAVDANAITVALYRNGVQVNAGKATDAMGDQWQALLVLVNTLVAQGRTIEPGQFILTGALGQMVPGEAGEYRGAFGALGELQFAVAQH